MFYSELRNIHTSSFIRIKAMVLDVRWNYTLLLNELDCNVTPAI
jgi:hypothetical protein